MIFILKIKETKHIFTSTYECNRGTNFVNGKFCGQKKKIRVNNDLIFCFLTTEFCIHKKRNLFCTRAGK